MASTRELTMELPGGHLFKRCVQCPDATPPCPQCGEDEVCSQTAQSCDKCLFSQCVKTSVSGSTNNGITNSPKSGPNIGAIVGGVVGGIVIVGVLAFFIWWTIKKRRRQQQEAMGEYEFPTEKQNDFAMHRSARNSTHTVQSMASTVLTRASNIIQIAYIPGVTNRAGGASSPGLLVPPVPPIPSATTNSQPGTPYSTEDQHFFMPGDLRDSTYSGLSGRESAYTRNSISPSLARSSVATTIYRSNAVVSPTPAQTIVRGKPAIVSVSSKASSPTDNATPPVPSIDHTKYTQDQRDGPSQRPIMIRMPGSSESINKSSPASASQKSGQTIVGKPTALTIVKKGKKTQDDSASQSSSTATSLQGLGLRGISRGPSIAESFDSNATHARAQRSVEQATAAGADSDSETEEGADEHARSRRSLVGHSNPNSSQRDSEITEIQDTPGSVQSPFTDAGALSPGVEGNANGKQRLSAVAEEASRSRRGSKQDVEKAKKERERMEREDGNRSPFEDENEV
ncbi:hypothetical protein K402DRAFT_423822 [Aulographum hederae CBS 113979]|uniref:Membrane anchor Opy2 N-terminal domain-containing protein n=1 Tax=Aulographum hederae CBS 113979 TaxID=1176131 RepID=A0A6G1GR78_9PEZI|nr:hypothetical protein K402DRAFT_423822 [Aulographum hederae CBS 113979]